MTRDRRFKQRVRERMRATGENYASARESLRPHDSAESGEEAKNMASIAKDSEQTEGAESVAGAWASALAASYRSALAGFSDTLGRCPDDKWNASAWVVKATDPYIWPIHRGTGAELPDEERLQLQSAFWNVAYHAIFHLDFALEGGWSGTPYEPPEPFRGEDHFGNVLPERPYTRAELVEYVSYCAKKSTALFATTTPEDAGRVVGDGEPFAQMLIGGLLHLQEHRAQLDLLLGSK